MDLKKKTILFSLIFGIIALILVSFAIYPLFKGIKKDSEGFIAVKKELTLCGSKVGKFEQFKKIYKELEPDLERIERIFVDPEVPIDLIEFWEKTAINSELSINISPVSLKAVETDPWNSIGFQIAVIGSFSDFLKFLEKIETGPYLIKIQNLSVKRLTEEEISSEKYKLASSGDVSITLLTKVFTK